MYHICDDVKAVSNGKTFQPALIFNIKVKQIAFHLNPESKDQQNLTISATASYIRRCSHTAGAKYENSNRELYKLLQLTLNSLSSQEVG